MIEDSGVTIQTVSVTIKALKINNRQMTQAVFNQLPELEELIDTRDHEGELLETYRPVGNVWGWVNYCPKGGDAELRQFIVEIDGRLYRAASPIDTMRLLERMTHDFRARHDIRLLCDRLTTLVLAIIAEAASARRDEPPGHHGTFELGDFPGFGIIRAAYDTQSYPNSEIVFWVDLAGRKLTLVDKWSNKHARALQWTNDGPEKPWHRYSEPLLKDMHKITEAGARDQAERVAHGIVAHIEKTNKFRATLAAAEQLFIAV
jgi:hypothetical protein